MAAAIRLGVVAAGPFGRRVAALLPDAVPLRAGADPAEDGLVHRRTGEPVDPAGLDVLVAALWRPWPALCEHLDAVAFRTGTPWLPVLYDSPSVRVGPLIRPPAGPCFRCYLAREAQHDDDHDLTAAIRAGYDADPAVGPAAGLPQHARIAAGLIALTLEQGHHGRVRTADPATGTVFDDAVLTCAGCARCGPSVALELLSARVGALFAAVSDSVPENARAAR